MERKVGEIFIYNGKTYQVVRSIVCAHCAFRERVCISLKSYTGPCGSSIRSDKISVIFKEINNIEINNMEIKNNQLTIEIPKGMEIDLENSNLTKGIVKFKKKDITYCEVTDALKIGENCESIVINGSNASKLVALSKLMNIAKYYNGDWKPNWTYTGEVKIYISYDVYKDVYTIDTCGKPNGSVYFKSLKSAKEVVHNPNFKDVLDAIYKN